MSARRTIRTIVEGLPALGQRPAVGLQNEIGLRWWTYAELEASARRAAALLLDAGVGPGERVVFWAPSSPEWVGFFLGAMLIGAVVVPVDEGVPLEAVRVTLDYVESKLIVATAGREVPSGVHRLDFESLRSAERPAPPAPPAPPLNDDSPALVLLTSGTTSHPRGVVITHGNLNSQIEQFAGWRWLTRLWPFRMLVSAPLSHSQGLVLGLCIPVGLGLGVVYTHHHHPAHVLRTIRDARITILATVPRVLSMLMHDLERRSYGWGASRRPLGAWIQRTRSEAMLRHRIFTSTRQVLGYRLWIVTVGGATFARDVERFWRHTGALVTQGYGLTETAAMITVNAPLFGSFGSVGKPLAGRDIRIADDGEIMVRGPTLTPGYYGEPPGDVVDADGYFPTGDLGRFDGRRRLFFEGRKKDVIVTSEGFNVYPNDVEAALDAQPGVRESVVVQVEREGNAEVHAVVVLEPGRRAEDIVRGANAALAPHQRINGFTEWPDEALPRGALFKVQRNAVVTHVTNRDASESAGEREPSGPVTVAQIRAATDRATRIRLVARYLRECTAAERVSDADARVGLVDDLGLTSLDLADLSFHLEANRRADARPLVIEANATLADVRERLSAEVDDPSTIPAIDRRRPPRWAAWRPLIDLRRLLGPLFVLPWIRACARITVKGREHLDAADAPFVFDTQGHEHGSDVLAVFAALPRPLRRVAVVTSRWVFGYYLDPEPHVPWFYRAAVGFGFNFAIPLFFPLAPVPRFGASREGLIEACRLIDRGFSLIVFEGLGTELVAEQTGRAVVPVHLSGNVGMSYIPSIPRRTIEVTFGQPRYVPARLEPTGSS